MADTWDFYFSNVNGELASLFIDLGLAEVAPDRHRPWLLWAWVYMNLPREDGLSSAEEAPLLDDLEESLMEAVEESTGAELVGRITTSGRREFYFYGPSIEGFEDAIGRVMSDRPEYRFDTGLENDPEWNHYVRVLYPSPHDIQCIKNRRVIEVLQEHGDALDKPRTLSHWACFPSEAARQQFAAAAVGLGYRVVNQGEVEKTANGQRFGVTFERSDSVDWASINEVTIELYELADSCGGDYDGWESPVQK